MDALKWLPAVARSCAPRARRCPRTFGLIALALTSIASAGCHAKLRPEHAAPAAAVAATHRKLSSLDTLPADCEVALQLAYGGDFNLSGEAVQRGRAPFGDSAELNILSHPACVKQAGKPPEMPNQITLEMDDAKFDHYRMCVDDTFTEANDSPIGSKGSCQWNWGFRHEFPLSFVFYAIKSGAPAPAKAPELSSYIRLLRVYRNSELVYRWVSSDALEATPLSGKHVLLIPGEALTERLMPHLAQLDLRLLGTDATIDAAMLNEEIAARHATTLDRIQDALNAAAGSEVFAVGGLKGKIEALEVEAKEIACESRALVDPTWASTCKTSPLPPGSSLTELYTRLREGAAAEAQKLHSKAEAELLQYAAALDKKGQEKLETFKKEATDYWYGRLTSQDGWSKLLKDAQAKSKVAELAATADAAAFQALAAQHTIPLPSTVDAALLGWFKLRASETRLEDILAKGDKLIMSALGTVRNASELVATLRADMKKLASDDRAQALLFRDVHKSLEETSVFSQYADNPPRAEGEKILLMKYSDQHQWYTLAPWHGVSVRVTEDFFDTDLNAATLIPVIDVVGSRWQLSKSRFGDVRVALGVANTFETGEVATTGPDGEPATKERQLYRFVPQLSFGAATFRIGVGLAIGAGEFDSVSDRIRIFFGADLVKFISGRNPDLALY